MNKPWNFEHTSALVLLFFVTLFNLNGLAAAATNETILHRFMPDGADAASPSAAMIMDRAGNLYSTSYYGGTYNTGTVFELSPANGGGYTEHVLYTFRASGGDGTNPEGNLVFDSSGNLYGTAETGGAYGAGTVFELVHAANGTWSEKIIHNFKFNGTDGGAPEGGLVFDAAGNLYSTTSGGGMYGDGSVFELTPAGNGNWTERVLYSFNPGNGTDGGSPQAGLIFDSAGNLYGTTTGGGTGFFGTVFKLSPAGGGNWTESVLYSFTGGLAISTELQPSAALTTAARYSSCRALA